MVETATGQPDNSTGGSALPFSPYEFRIAFRYIGAKRKHGGIALIAVLSFVAVMLAVTALIVIMSVMNGFRHELLNNLLGAQPHMIIDARELPPEQIDPLVERITSVDGIIAAEPVVMAEVLSLSGEYTAGVRVVGIRPDDLARRDAFANVWDPRRFVGVAYGSLDGFGAGRNGGDRVIVGSGVAQRLGRVFDGDSVTIISPVGAQGPFGNMPRRKAYEIGGVVQMGVYEIDAFTIFMPLEQAQLLFNRGDRVDEIHVRTTDVEQISALMPTVTALLDNPDIIADYTQLNPAYFSALQFERIAMRLIMAVVIAIAAMNIISGLVMLVKNKGRDIAILRTMGATQNSILRIFLIIGSCIGMLGTAAGILLGLLMVWNIGPIQDVLNIPWDASVYVLPRIPARMDWSEVIFASIFCFGVSLVVTILPALRAARLDPVEALRYE
jgi:lipoprotein-releasing system permease protein